jgi:polyisoprenoid-binding protein YceI
MNMKKYILLTVLALSQFSLFSQTKWEIDPVHSNVKFSVNHLVISEVEGSFKVFNGTMNANNPDFTNATIEFSVDVNSINTDNEMRDKHLKSDDFFNAEKYPKMTFKSESFRKIVANKYQLSGNLTIRNVTKPVKFEVYYGGTAKDGYGNIKAGFRATAKINRISYGLKWNTLTETGGAVVSQDVNIILKLEFTQAKGK